MRVNVTCKERGITQLLSRVKPQKPRAGPLALRMDVPDAGCQICLSQAAKDLAFGC